jgi:hypothetical protein
LRHEVFFVAQGAVVVADRADYVDTEAEVSEVKVAWRIVNDGAEPCVGESCRVLDEGVVEQVSEIR